MTEEDAKLSNGKMLSIKINEHIFCLGYTTVAKGDKIADVIITTSPIEEKKIN